MTTTTQGWKSPEDVPCDHLNKQLTPRVHHISKGSLLSKNPKKTERVHLKYHIDVNDLIAYVKPKTWLKDCQLAVNMEYFGHEEFCVGLSLIYDDMETDDEFHNRCKKYQREKFRERAVLDNLSEEQEREVYERLKIKYDGK
jgi:hypothetical protein